MHFAYLCHVEVLEEEFPKLGVGRVKQELKAHRRDLHDTAAARQE